MSAAFLRSKKPEERQARRACVERPDDLTVHIADILPRHPRDEAAIGLGRTCLERRWRWRRWLTPTVSAPSERDVGAHTAVGNACTITTGGVANDVAKFNVPHLWKILIPGVQLALRTFSVVVTVADASWVRDVVEKNVVDVSTSAALTGEHDPTLAKEN